MANFQKLFINFMLIGLVVFGLFTFVADTQSHNGVTTKFTDNPTINASFGNLSADLLDSATKSKAQKALFESEKPTVGVGTILLFSIISAGKVFNGLVIGVFNTLIKLPVTFLGLDPVIVAVLSTILILVIILGLWAVYKLGS